jgi:gas vesicle protein
MNTHSKGNGTRHPAQIRAEIMRTRDEMDHTLHAIERRLTPGELVDQGLDYLKNSGAKQYATNLVSSVKTYPIPATLAGIGIAWLAAVSKPASPDMNESSGPGIGDRMQSAKESVTGTMQSAKDSVSGTMQSARERASQLTDTARQTAERAKDSWDRVLNEHPLALGAVGLAIGALAAAMAPRTEKEDRLMGDARDKLLDQAKQKGTQVMETAAQAVSSKTSQQPETTTPGTAASSATPPTRPT